MIGLILIKIIFKTLIVTSKRSVVKKISVLGVIGASGIDEYNRKNSYGNSRNKFKNNYNNHNRNHNNNYDDDDDDIKLIE